MNDLVSIIMPSYNTAKYIAESIESVLSQSYKNWELIIVDDCSDDNTDNVVSKYLGDNRIRYIKNERNSGAAVSRNRALREANGRWIAFLDSDDLWMSSKLEKQICFMETNNYGFSYTKYEEIDEKSVSLGRYVSGPRIISERGMYNYCWPGCLTVMYDVRKIGLIQIGDIKKNNDYAMWLKICKKENCYFLNEILGKYRRRSGSISRSNYVDLLKWHYKLFRDIEGMGICNSVIQLIVNVIFGSLKKLKYISR